MSKKQNSSSIKYNNIRPSGPCELEEFLSIEKELMSIEEASPVPKKEDKNNQILSARSSEKASPAIPRGISSITYTEKKCRKTSIRKSTPKNRAPKNKSQGIKVRINSSLKPSEIRESARDFDPFNTLTSFKKALENGLASPLAKRQRVSSSKKSKIRRVLQQAKSKLTVHPKAKEINDHYHNQILQVAES